MQQTSDTAKRTSSPNFEARQPHWVFIGGGTFPFSSYAAVSEAYRGTIACLGLGQVETPSCMVLDEEGRPIAIVSYNGRVFSVSEDAEVDYNRPIFEPCD